MEVEHTPLEDHFHRGVLVSFHDCWIEIRNDPEVLSLRLTSHHRCQIWTI